VNAALLTPNGSGRFSKVGALRHPKLMDMNPFGIQSAAR